MAVVIHTQAGCLHGWPMGLALRCTECEAIADELDAAFEAGVTAGKWNARGYTPQEWTRHEAQANS